MEDRVDGLISKLKDAVMPTRLSFNRPKSICNFWVFWSKEKASNHTLTYSDRIKTSLSAWQSFDSSEVLVQFWAATTTMTEDGRRLLTTSDQPFAIHNLTDEKLIQYKKDCPIYKSVAEGEEDYNLIDGPVNRVFRRQLPEMSPDLSYYSVKEYPERDLALACGIKATVALPVFEPSQQCCVGVLELLITKYPDFKLDYHVYCAIDGLKVAGLETVNAGQLRRHIREEHSVLVKEELKGAMEQVSKTHCLPLACVWARCEHISSVGRVGSLNRRNCREGFSDVNCREGLLVSITGTCVFDDDDYDIYNDASLSLPLTVGQGPVAKAFLSDKPCFCRDVAQLSVIDYPLAHFARKSRLTGCFAVCLKSIATGNRVYALEFFLPQYNSHSGDHNFLSSILTILKQHLKSFEVVTGDIRNDLFTEGQETTSPSMEFTSFHTISSLTISSSEGFTSLKRISRCTEAEDSARRSLRSRSVESTLNSMHRKPNIYSGPSDNRSYLDLSPSKINEPVDSETGSTSLIKLSGHMMSRRMKSRRMMRK